MREGIEAVGKWRNVWARGEYASLTLGGMDAPVYSQPTSILNGDTKYSFSLTISAVSK